MASEAQPAGGPQPEQVHEGRCFCGAIGIEAAGEPEAQGFCHCKDCRSYAGAPVTAFTLRPKDKLRVTRGEGLLGRYDKRGFSERRFCTACGGHLFVEHPTLGMVDVHAASLPGFAFRPSVHLNYESTELPMKDGLPKLKDFPAEIGGSGETMEE
jgi:hypothetical protein